LSCCEVPEGELRNVHNALRKLTALKTGQFLETKRNPQALPRCPHAHGLAGRARGAEDGCGGQDRPHAVRQPAIPRLEYPLKAAGRVVHTSWPSRRPWKNTQSPMSVQAEAACRQGPVGGVHPGARLLARDARQDECRLGAQCTQDCKAYRAADQPDVPFQADHLGQRPMRFAWIGGRIGRQSQPLFDFL